MTINPKLNYTADSGPVVSLFHFQLHHRYEISWEIKPQTKPVVDSFSYLQTKTHKINDTYKSLFN